MRHSFLKYGFLAAIIFVASLSAARAGNTGIPMLPPMQFGTSAADAVANPNNYACTTASAGMLYWDGADPIFCIPGFTGDKAGNVGITAGNLYIGANNNSTNGLFIDGIGPLLGVNATALLQLGQANCGTSGTQYQVLTRSNNIISCTGVTDLVNLSGTHIGKTMMPACPANTVLTSNDGLTFSCVSITCPTGQTLTGISGGQPVCTPVSTMPNCNSIPSTVQFDGTNFVCTPTCPGFYTTDLYAYSGNCDTSTGKCPIPTANGNAYIPQGMAVGQIMPPDYPSESISPTGCGGNPYYYQCTLGGWTRVGYGLYSCPQPADGGGTL